LCPCPAGRTSWARKLELRARLRSDPRAARSMPVGVPTLERWSGIWGWEVAHQGTERVLGLLNLLDLDHEEGEVGLARNLQKSRIHRERKAHKETPAQPNQRKAGTAQELRHTRRNKLPTHRKRGNPEALGGLGVGARKGKKP
ncbi:hypothetical protein H1C71_022423, partial [Ictidomys tridecemlineatus]